MGDGNVFGAVGPYAPVMQAVASCYVTLSNFVESASHIGLTPEEQRSQAEEFLQSQDTVTQALASTREVWSGVWTGQDAVNLRGNQLLVLIEDASQIFNSIVALVELLIIASEDSWFGQLYLEIQQVIKQLAIEAQMLSKAIASEKKNVYFEDLDRAIEALEHQWQVRRSQFIDWEIDVQNDYANLANIAAASLVRTLNLRHTLWLLAVFQNAPVVYEFDFLAMTSIFQSGLNLVNKAVSSRPRSLRLEPVLQCVHLYERWHCQSLVSVLVSAWESSRFLTKFQIPDGCKLLQ